MNLLNILFTVVAAYSLLRLVKYTEYMISPKGALRPWKDHLWVFAVNFNATGILIWGAFTPWH